MNATSTRTVVVQAGGTQAAGLIGLHVLGAFADRLGVGESLSGAVGWAGAGTPNHDRGRVLTQAMLMLAGGESCADIETLAPQDRLFSDVRSDTTLYRTFTQSFDTTAVDRARRAMAELRAEVWQRTCCVRGARSYDNGTASAGPVAPLPSW